MTTVVGRVADVDGLAAFLADCYAVQGSPAELASAISCYLLGHEPPPMFELMVAAALARPEMDVFGALLDAGFSVADAIDHHVDVAEKIKEPTA